MKIICAQRIIQNYISAYNSTSLSENPYTVSMIYAQRSEVVVTCLTNKFLLIEQG